MHRVLLKDIMHHSFTGEHQGGWIRTELMVLLSQHSVVHVNCMGVAIDAAIWHAAVAQLCADRSQGKEKDLGALILTQLTLTSRRNLWLALFAEVGLSVDVRNCCVLMEEGNLRYPFGKIEYANKETLDDLRRAGQLVAADLKHLSLSNASSRLKTLFDLGMCTRDFRRDGRSHAYVYSFVSEGLEPAEKE